MQTRRLFTPSKPFIARPSMCSAVLVASGLMLSGCVADDVDPAGMGGTGGGAAGGGGSGTSGGGGSSGNTQGGGGSSGAPGGIMSNPEFGMKIACPAPGQALLLDFAPLVATAGDAGTDAGPAADAGPPAPDTDSTFGDFTTNLSGGTYVYPGDGAWPVTSDVTGGNWHMTGDIGTYSGFGLYLNETCNVVDLSMYDGISFTISGNVAMMGTLTMTVATSANDVTHLWLNTVPMPPPNPPARINSGRCIPPGTNQFDGSCGAPAYTVTVPAQPTTVTVLWSQFTGGRPSMTLDPTEITGIAWAFPAPAGAGGETPVTYPIDIVVDDITLVNNP